MTCLITVIDLSPILCQYNAEQGGSILTVVLLHLWKGDGHGKTIATADDRAILAPMAFTVNGVFFT